MRPRARRARAIVRDRRRGWSVESMMPPLFGPLTGFDLYLTHRYLRVPPEGELLARIFPEP